MTWQWWAEHWAEVAWGAFAVLSLIVGVYRLNERAIKARVARTATQADDKLVHVLDWLVAVFDVLRLFVPTLIGQPTRKNDDGPE